MMFFSCFLLLNFIAAHGTAESVPVNENLGKNQRTPLNFQSQYTQDGMECPKYRVLKKYPGFEYREYEESKWITSPVELTDEGLKTSYNNLCQYYKGFNSAGVHMSFTAPVQLLFSFGNGDSISATMGMFLSAKLKSLPAPLKSDKYPLKLKKFIKIVTYVRFFTGDISGDNIQENMDALTTDLKGQGLDFDTSFIVCNVFDFNSGFSKTNNEIWVLAI